MIAAVTGEVLLKDTNEVVIQSGGVGYRILVPERVAAALGSSGSEAQLYTYLAVRDDALQLYGFPSWQEREVFSILITVSGIGPKTALGILNQLTQAELVQAVLTENIRLLTTVNGIGQKTAQRLIMELKDKLSRLGSDLSGSVQTPGFGEGNELQEVIEALVALGYPQITAARAGQRAVQEVGEGATVQELLKTALKYCRNMEV